MLCLRFWIGRDEQFGRAVYLGGFHAVSAFNNAGFACSPTTWSGSNAIRWCCS